MINGAHAIIYSLDGEAPPGSSRATWPPFRHPPATSQPVAANTLRDRRVMSFSGRAFSYC